VLVERAGEVVSKDELFRVVWLDTVVSDSALTSCIQELRRALGDDAQRPQFIETLHRRGYRFRGQVSRDPRQISRCVSPAPTFSVDGPIVGRDAELALLLERWRRIGLLSLIHPVEALHKPRCPEPGSRSFSEATA